MNSIPLIPASIYCSHSRSATGGTPLIELPSAPSAAGSSCSSCGWASPSHCIRPVLLTRSSSAGLGTKIRSIPANRGGGSTVAWGVSPLRSLAEAHQAVIGVADPNWLIGVLFALLLAVVVWADRRFLLRDFVGMLLLAGLLLGLTAADSAWVMLALVLLLYRGTPLLIALNQKWQGGLLQQRGLVLAIAFALATVFMMADKARHQAIALGTVNPQEQLIQFLAQEITDDNKDFIAASQWPGRTMVAVRRAVFPLPRAASDGPTLLEHIKGITHLVFDHYDIHNRDLARNVAELGGAAETRFLEKGGVVVQINRQHAPLEHDRAPAATQPPAAPAPARYLSAFFCSSSARRVSRWCIR